jgi:hypothetical protein
MKRRTNPSKAAPRIKEHHCPGCGHCSSPPYPREHFTHGLLIQANAADVQDAVRQFERSGVPAVIVCETFSTTLECGLTVCPQHEAELHHPFPDGFRDFGDPGDSMMIHLHDGEPSFLWVGGFVS